MTGSPGDEGKGRSRLLIILGGALLAGLLALLLAPAASVDDFVTLGLVNLRQRVVARLGPDVPMVQEQRFQRSFACVLVQVRAKRVSQTRVGDFARACRRATDDGIVTFAELRQLQEQADALCALGE